MTQPAPPSDAMWYIVTNSTGSANSFADRSWRPPDVLGGETEVMQELWVRAWAGAGPDEPGNVTTARFEIKVVPKSGPAADAALRFESAEGSVDVCWERFGGPRADQYEVWLVCPGGSERRIAIVAARNEGESGCQPYRVKVVGSRQDADCAYRLDAILADGSKATLDWARPRSGSGIALGR